jgi:hypothetical protein
MTRLRLVSSTGPVHRRRPSAAAHLRLVGQVGSLSQPRRSSGAKQPRGRRLSLAVGLAAMVASALVAISGFSSMAAELVPYSAQTLSAHAPWLTPQPSSHSSSEVQI